MDRYEQYVWQINNWIIFLPRQSLPFSAFHHTLICGDGLYFGLLLSYIQFLGFVLSFSGKVFSHQITVPFVWIRAKQFFLNYTFYLRLVKQYNCYFSTRNKNFAVEFHVFLFTWLCYVENQRWNQSKMDKRLESGFDIKMKHFCSRNNFSLAYLSVQCSRVTVHWQLTSFGDIPPRISSNVLFVCNLFLVFRKLKQQCQRCSTKATWIIRNVNDNNHGMIAKKNFLCYK